MLGVLAAGALFASVAGGSAQGRPTSSVPGCQQWSVGFTWCVGVRPGHVLLTLSPAMVGRVEVFRGSEILSDQKPVAAGSVQSGASPTFWESPKLRPGVYSVFSRALPAVCFSGNGGCITIYITLNGVVRVPAANTARPAVQIKRR